MSIVTIKWQGENEEQTLKKEFKFTGGCGFEIYQNIANLLTVLVWDKRLGEQIYVKVEKERAEKGGLLRGRIEEYDGGVRDDIARMQHMVESLCKIHAIMGLPHETDKQT